MPFDILFWDEKAQMQRTRQSTPEEDAQRDADVVSSQPVPAAAVPMLNLHLVLIEDDLLDDVEAAIKSMQGKEGKRARAYWDKAQTARLDNPLVTTLGALVYKDETAFNEAWARAAALNP